MAGISTQFLEGSAVTTPKIANDAVDNTKIADNAVDSLQIAASAVVEAKIADSAVTANKLASDSVTTIKILDSNVTAAKLASDSVTTVKILDANVTLAKLAANSVDASKIVTGSVGSDELNSEAITGQTAETSPDNADLVLIYDNSATALKKMTRANFLSGIQSTAFKIDNFTLVAGDITNQYIDLSFVAELNSIHFMVKGAGYLLEGASLDYTVSYTGGAGGVTRITFVNDLATGGNAALVAGNIVQVKYEQA